MIALLALAAAVSILQGARNALEYSQDFQWDAAKALAEGIDPYALSLRDGNTAEEIPQLAGFYRMFTDRGLEQRMEANQFPTLLMLLFPMTIFEPRTAKVLWLFLNLLFTAGIAFLLRKTFFEDAGSYEYALIILLMLAGTPYRNQLGVGQHTLFAFFFFMLAVYFDRTDVKGDLRNSALVTFCLFVSYFKYTLTAPLALYFVYRKRYREIAASVAAHIALTAVFALRFKTNLLYMIKAPLMVASRLSAEGGIDIGVWLMSPLSYVVAVIIAAALVILTIKLPKDNEGLLISVLIMWSLILTYHRTYDFFVLSAAAAVYCMKGFHNPDGVDGPAVMPIAFSILMIAVYFGLRVFNENTFSKICIGILYYLYTFALTFDAVRVIGNNEENRYEDE